LESPTPSGWREVRLLCLIDSYELQASEASEQYQLQKMRCLRDINVDSNTVGWYQSAPYNDFQTIQIIETFISYDESVKKCVCIVCDIKDSVRGSLALKAIRLNKKFMDLYKKNANVCPASHSMRPVAEASRRMRA
jgi:hypothetical protein